MSEPSEGFVRCLENSSVCLGMVDCNCCGTRPTKDDTPHDILSQSDETDDSQDFEAVTAKKTKAVPASK